MSRMSRRGFLEAAAGAMAAIGAQQALGAPRPGRRPNFVVILADDMGYGDLGCFGHPIIRTPHLDRMADGGIRLTSFYAAASFCTPSRAALMTGRYPSRAGLPNNLGPESQHGLPLSEQTLAQALKPLGYRTKCIGKWHLGHTPDYVPTARGFDSYYGLMYSNDMQRPWVGTDIPLQLYHDTEPIEYPVSQDTLTERYTREAVQFIRDSGDEPFFLYLPHNMPHLPIHASDRFRDDSRGGLYGDVIETLDWSTGEILRTLRAQGLDDNTMVVFTSDNGPWLDLSARMLAGGVQRWHGGSPGPLRGYKATSYEGGHRVPAIVRWPGRVPEGQVSADIASTIDLHATIRMAAGAGMPDDRVLDGQDLTPFLEGREASPVHEFFYQRGEDLEGVRQDNWKLRYTRHKRTDLGQDDPLSPELYDLDQDVSERYNRADEFPEMVSSLQARLREFAEEIGATVAG